MSVKKKSLYEWFSTRVNVNIRNEENYALKRSIRFSYAKALVLGASFFVLFSIFTLWVATKVIGFWYNPREDYFNTKRKVIQLAMSVDSLEEQIRQKDLFIKHVKNIIETGEIEVADQHSTTVDLATESKVQEVDLDHIPEIDSVFRNQYESSNLLTTISNEDKLGLKIPTLFAPTEGTIIEKFDLKNKKYGIKLEIEESSAIVNVYKGVVIFSTWSLKDGYVLAIQHPNNLVSVYKLTFNFLKTIGNWVDEGEVLALKNGNEKAELVFEIWYKGEAVNPAELINF